MRIAEEKRRQVIEIDRRYRSSWDSRSIGHAVGLGYTTVAKILRKERGPRPKPEKRPHDRRTCFLRRDAMWSSDFMSLPDGRKLIKTMDEMSRYRLGWDASKTDTAAAAVAHGRAIIARMKRWPLVWKYDHGSPFTSDLFQDFLAQYKILGYPIPPRSPWVNGRNERDNQEVQNWLIPSAVLTGQELERDIDDGMIMLNYIKPRAVMGFKKSADVYFNTAGIEDIDRGHFILKVRDFEAQIGLIGSEQTQRKAIRLALEYWELYKEWKEVPRWAKVSTDLGR